MCLIIQRPANITLDKEKLGTAIDVNPDGYGIAVADGRGKLITLRSPDKPDIEDLFSLLHGEFKENSLMLHLRFTTAGKTNLRNAHPFPVLEYKEDGVDVRMAHNGTISTYKQKAETDESDSRAFVRMFVRPLFKRLIKGSTTEDIFTDPFIEELLKNRIPGGSVLTFLDGFGNTMVINALGNGGKYEDDGVYLSNTYSFRANHRKSFTETDYGYTYGGYGGYSGFPGSSDWDSYTKKKSEESAKEKKETLMKGLDTPMFTEKYELEEEDLLTLSDDTIETIVEMEPEDAVLLIKELLCSLKFKKDETTSLTRQLDFVKGKLSQMEGKANAA
jgi:hypothetical protein